MGSYKQQSKQNQYKGKRVNGGGASLRSIVHFSDDVVSLTPPPYVPDSMMRDKWLSEFWRKESHLAGVIRNITQIDTNRGWELTGGRNQVNRYRQVFHGANEGAGFRQFVEQLSLSYHTSDLGAIIELGRDGTGGPVYGIYSADSTKFNRTGNRDFPIRYHGNDRPEDWSADDFRILVNQPTNSEEFMGLGFCTVSRCIQFARTMIGITNYEDERLGSRAPQGILFLHNVAQETWGDAMQFMDASASAKERQWFGGVAVIASSGTDQPSGEIMALSELPTGFDRARFEESLMAGYALASGYDPAEFWPVGGSSFGHSVEVETQHKKATGKGRMAFTKALEEAMLTVLPESLSFQFTEDDRTGMIEEATFKKSSVESIVALLEKDLIDKEQAKYLLAADGIIPEEWAVSEIVTLDDSDGLSSNTLRNMRDKSLSNPAIRRAIEASPSEPIVSYRCLPDKPPFEIMLWESGNIALKKAVWALDSEHFSPKPIRPTTRLQKTPSSQANLATAIAIAEKRMGELVAKRLR